MNLMPLICEQMSRYGIESRYMTLSLFTKNMVDIEKVKKLLPELTQQESEDIILFYCPGPKSKSRYDQLSLFYNSCRSKQAKPLEYIQNYSSDMFLKIGWIAYVFKRADIFEELIANSELPAESETFYFRELYNILLADSEKEYSVFNKPSALYKYITMIILLLSAERIKRLLDASYKVNVHPNNMREKWVQSDLSKLDTNAHANEELLNHIYSEDPERDIIINYFWAAAIGLYSEKFGEASEQDKGACYLFAGRIIEYLAWKRKGLKLSFDSAFTLNGWFDRTYNNDIPSDLLNGTGILPETEENNTNSATNLIQLVDRITSSDLFQNPVNYFI